MRRFDYHRPDNLSEALRLKESLEGARFIAGGTDLIVQMKERRHEPPDLISLRSVTELAAVEMGQVTRIGAMALLEDLIHHPALRSGYPALIQALRRMGSVQIRNSATLGGNLCNASPAADGAPPLLVLDARVELRGSDGVRELPLSEFFVGPGQTQLRAGEILTAILIDPPPPTSRTQFLRKDRVHIDLSLASAAVYLDLESDGETCRTAKIAVGAVAPTPCRLPSVEDLLAGQKITPELAAQAGELARAGIAPITDVRSSAYYRRHITGVLVKRAIEILLGWRSE